MGAVRMRLRPSAAPLLAALLAGTGAAADFHDWAPTPPMGWNSWDCFATTVTELRTLAEADVMARQLAPHGWRYVVVDIQWYEPDATGYGYREHAPLTLDPYGRLLPAPKKFPSAASGGGFSGLAAAIHARGLKFGIHLMRGIPRQAVAENLPILGTPYHAADIADTVHVCPWNTDMYGVDMSKPGAQAYYDSVFALIASWGVDFLKVDDLSRPYIRNEPEIEAIRAAIGRTGRPMVLSLSPGETDIRAAAHVVDHANMWRISDDFWDHWSLLLAQFARLDAWTPWRRPGAWPDADMIPIGTIDLGRRTWFSRDEQVTLMTLWSIARSPLMLGADLTRLDPATLSLLTNDEVIAVNQASSGNRQLFRNADGSVGWVADAPRGGGRYVALFNTRDPWVLSPGHRLWKSSPVTLATPGRSVEFEVPVKGLRTLVLDIDDGDSVRFWWPAVVREARWTMADGRTVKLDRDYGSHGEKRNPIDVPEGAVSLHGRCLLDDAAVQANDAAAFMVFSAYGFAGADLERPGQAVRLDLGSLALGGRVAIRDLWARRSLGVFSTAFAPEIPWHGAGLYQVTAAPAP